MSIFDLVTVQQFKEYFNRDFSFLPVFILGKVYFKDDIVFQNDTFYKSLKDNNTSILTDDTAWQVTRGNKNDYITDEDVYKAMGQAKLNANEKFGECKGDKINIFLHLVAFYLVMDLRNASGGIYTGFVGMTQSKSVDGVSESFAIPQYLLNNPVYSIYAQNGYGMKYLSLILPYMATTVMFSPGGTTLG